LSSTRGKRGIVELDRPAVLGSADEHVGDHRFGFLGDEAAAGLGIVGAKLAHHVGEVLVIDSADALEVGHRPLASRSRLAISRAIAGS
jgi:hypothetical protein